MTLPKPNRQRRQRGVTIVFTALMLTALCGVAALAVDVGVVFGAKNSAQNAADAAALAAAFTFLNPGNAQPGAAQTAAITLAAANDVEGTPAVITASDVTVDTANQRVTVQVPRTGSAGIPAIFATVFGIQHTDVIATATAEASPVATGSICLRPIFVPNTILSSETPSTACGDGHTILDGNGNLTAYALGKLGTQEVLRPTSPGGTLAPSQFYSLDLSNGTSNNGASTYSCALGTTTLLNCGITPGIAACGSSYPTENGNMVGPTQQGISTLVGSTPDTWVAVGAYEQASGTITDTSPQLISAPVWDDCCPTCQVGSGGGTITIIGFTSWFVDGIANGGGNPGVEAHFVGAAGCGAGGSGGGAGAATNAPLGIPVRLVTP